MFYWYKIFMNYTEQLSPDTAQKLSFSLRICSVYVTKSAGNCRFGQIYWKNLDWKTSFFCAARDVPRIRATSKMVSLTTLVNGIKALLLLQSALLKLAIIAVISKLSILLLSRFWIQTCYHQQRSFSTKHWEKRWHLKTCPLAL